MTQKFDALIIGGGLTGACLFIALADEFISHNNSLVLCERTPAYINDNRMLALGYAGGKALAEIGIWENVSKDAYPIYSLQISCRQKKRTHNFVVKSSDIGLPAMGWTILHRKLQDILWSNIKETASSHSNMQIKIPFEMQDIDLSSEYIKVIAAQDGMSKELATKEEASVLLSKLAFVATGAGSFPARRLKIDYHRFNRQNEYKEKNNPNSHLPYNSRFAVAEVKLNDYTEHRGYWFWDDNKGGMAVALTPHIKGKGSFVAILSLSYGIAKLTKDSYADLLNKLTSGLISEVSEEPIIFPAYTYLAKERVKGPVVLLGNAAHGVAPLGGQNFNLTLWTIAKLKSLLNDHLTAGKQITDRSFLANFIIDTEPLLSRHIQLINRTDKVLSSELNDLSRLIVSSSFGILERYPLIRNKIFSLATGVSRLSI